MSRVSKNPVVWDPEKLEWMNGVYLREMAPEEFAALMQAEMAAAGIARCIRVTDTTPRGGPSSDRWSPSA